MPQRPLMDAASPRPTALAERTSLRRPLRPAGRDGGDGRAAMIVVSVDRPGAISAQLGADGAATLLETLTVRLRATAGPDRAVERISADEFAIACGEPVDPRSAASLAAQLVDAVTPLIVVGRFELYLTADAGIAFP